VVCVDTLQSGRGYQRFRGNVTLHFYPEDVGSMSFRNVGTLLSDYIVSYLRRLQYEFMGSYCPSSSQFHNPSSNSSFVIAVKLNANEEFLMTSMLSFTFYEETHVSKICIFLGTLLTYIISGLCIIKCRSHKSAVLFLLTVGN
jgi:hypothetical protein